MNNQTRAKPATFLASGQRDAEPDRPPWRTDHHYTVLRVGWDGGRWRDRADRRRPPANC
jgi:hypothetical protein